MDEGECRMHSNMRSAFNNFINYQLCFKSYIENQIQELIEAQTELKSMRNASDLQKNITPLISRMNDYDCKCEKELDDAILTNQKLNDHIRTSKNLFQTLQETSDPTKRFEISKELYLAQLKQLDGDSVMCAFMDHPTKGTIQIYP